LKAVQLSSKESHDKVTIQGLIAGATFKLA
jgi:hypothetical protein